MARELKPCGTSAAYRRHLRHGEPACQACLDAAATERRPEGVAPRRAPEHGTRSKYCDGCRCASCTEANRTSAARWREAVAGLPVAFVPHGVNGYHNYGCRCAVCREAGARNNRAYRERRRVRESAAP